MVVFPSAVDLLVVRDYLAAAVLFVVFDFALDISELSLLYYIIHIFYRVDLVSEALDVFGAEIRNLLMNLTSLYSSFFLFLMSIPSFFNRKCEITYFVFCLEVTQFVIHALDFGKFVDEAPGFAFQEFSEKCVAIGLYQNEILHFWLKIRIGS